MRSMFWRYAYRRYHAKPISPVVGYTLIGFSVLMAIVFGIALVLAPWHAKQFLPLGAAVIGLPLIAALAHRKIMTEKAKGRNALLNKRREFGGRSSHA